MKMLFRVVRNEMTTTRGINKEFVTKTRDYI